MESQVYIDIQERKKRERKKDEKQDREKDFLYSGKKKN